MKQSKPRRKKRGKSFFDMTPAERDRYVARFDREIDIEKDTKPLTAKQRALFERARRADRFDEDLLKRAKAYARRKNLTMTQLVERGLRRELAVMD